MLSCYSCHVPQARADWQTAVVALTRCTLVDPEVFRNIRIQRAIDVELRRIVEDGEHEGCGDIETLVLAHNRARPLEPLHCDGRTPADCEACDCSRRARAH